MTKENLLTVSQAAAELGVRPRDLSDLFYQRRLTIRHGMLVGGRWLVRAERLGEIRGVLEAAGKLPAGSAA